MRCVLQLLSLSATVPYARGFVRTVLRNGHPLAHTGESSPEFRTTSQSLQFLQRRVVSTREVATTLRLSGADAPVDPVPADAPLGPVPMVGSEAPAFTVKDESGEEVTLASFKGDKNVVLYFYPKDNTPGCTKEAMKFRDLKSEYDALDCVILGVSADHEKSHTKFIEKYDLNFSLLADTNRALVKDYGASKPGDKIQRSTVIINKEGKIAAAWNPVSGAETHPEFVLEKLKEIMSA